MNIIENQVDETSDPKTDSEVDKMGASDDGDISFQFQEKRRNDSQVHVQKYPIGNLMLKKLDSGELSGFVKNFDTQSGLYSSME